MRMRKVRRANTSAERLIQAALRARAVQFVAHVPVMGCTPDLIVPGGRLAIFVDGDFWHGRVLVEHGARALEKMFPTEAKAFWVTKIRRNVMRDRKQAAVLRRHGWSVLRLWGRDVLEAPEHQADLVERRLRWRRVAV